MAGEVRRVGAYAKLLANYAADDAIIAAGEAAELLFVRGLAFCATSDSDGYITEAQMVRYVGAGMKDAAKRARKLVEVGLWSSVDGGYQVRSWTKMHETSTEKGRRRKADRERKASDVPRGIQTESARNPDGGSAGIPVLIHNRTDTETETSIAPDKPTRARDEIFDAVAEACGIDVSELTKSARGSLNAAVKQLKDVDAIPGQVKVRAARYRRTYSDAALTPSALAKHWSALGGDSGNGASSAELHRRAADPLLSART